MSVLHLVYWSWDENIPVLQDHLTCRCGIPTEKRARGMQREMLKYIACMRMCTLVLLVKVFFKVCATLVYRFSFIILASLKLG